MWFDRLVTAFSRMFMMALLINISEGVGAVSWIEQLIWGGLMLVLFFASIARVADDVRQQAKQ